MENKYQSKVWRGGLDILDMFSRLLFLEYEDTIFDLDYMKWKHLDNPLGPSLISYVLNSHGEMIAARSFWKTMNFDGRVFYQPCDTVTHQKYRRQGLFSLTTKACLSEINSADLVVNFPNQNSMPGYLKLGWSLYSDNLKKFSYFPSVASKSEISVNEFIAMFDDENMKIYCRWRFSGLSKKAYKFYKNYACVLIDNGHFSGVLNLGGMNQALSTFSGLRQGYVISKNWSTLKGLVKFSVALKCQSNTVYYDRGRCSVKNIEELMVSQDVVLLMDTF